MNFQEKLARAVQSQNSLLSIGLDTDIEKVPKHIRELPNAVFEFNKAIIDATHTVACAYKPNSAFYEGYGTQGLEQLKLTCDYLRQTYPEIVTVLDAKRGDIGTTNEGYVQYAFEYLGVDAITLHPYLGKEALQPFLAKKDKGCIILCRTSNPGSGEFQSLTTDGKPFYQIVAEKVVHEWNTNGNCLLVVGATYPEEMKTIRAITEDMTFLVPGIGAQGGNVKDTVLAGKTKDGKGMIINAARSIIFASSGEDFAIRACEEATRLKEEINLYR